MKFIKTYWQVFMALVGCYLLGMYTSNQMNYIQNIGLFQWISTGSLTVVFLYFGVKSIKDG